MNIVMAQIRVYVGDIKRNTDRIIAEIEKQKEMGGVDVLVFPELAVTGYNLGARLEDEQFLYDVERANTKIIQATLGTFMHVVFGTLRQDHNVKSQVPKRHVYGAPLFNAALVASEGRLVQTYYKRMLANDSHHEDEHYFTAGTSPATFNVRGKTIGILICEDIWASSHGVDLVHELKKLNPSLSHVVCLNYSYFTYQKPQLRFSQLRQLARSWDVAIAYVNALGMGDIVKNYIIYDGGSMYMEQTGRAYLFPHFKEKVGNANLMPASLRRSLPPERADKMQMIWDALVWSQQALLEETGIQTAQVHLSGGIDSAIVAALTATAVVDHRKIVFMTNPSVHNGSESQNRAKSLASKLGVPLHVIPVAPISEYIQEQMLNTLGTVNPMVVTTAEAVGRTVVGLSACHATKAGIIATGNHTENILGWFSFHDVGSIGLYQPLGDLTKLELFQLADWINKNVFDAEVIDRGLYNGEIKPAAELADANDDPFNYYIYSGICAEMIRRCRSVRQLLAAFKNDTLNNDVFPSSSMQHVVSYEEFEKAVYDAHARAQRSVGKGAQGAPILILSERSRGFSARETLLGNYKPGAFDEPEES